MGVKLPEVTFQSRAEKDKHEYTKFVFADGSIGYKDYPDDVFHDGKYRHEKGWWGKLVIISPDNTETVYDTRPRNGLYTKLRVNKPDGTIENFDVIRRTAYMDGQDDEFKRNFVKAMLKRLNLTAADLPGINLEPILGAGR